MPKQISNARQAAAKELFQYAALFFTLAAMLPGAKALDNDPSGSYLKNDRSPWWVVLAGAGFIVLLVAVLICCAGSAMMCGGRTLLCGGGAAATIGHFCDDIKGIGQRMFRLLPGQGNDLSEYVAINADTSADKIEKGLGEDNGAASENEEGEGEVNVNDINPGATENPYQGLS